jgi:hypothetical protein
MRGTTNMTMRKFAVAALALALLWPAAAAAQSTPQPALYYGYVPTAAQWNGYFAAKQDALGYSPLNKAGDTMLGKLIAATPSASLASLNLPHGTAPSAPTNGDMWTTTVGLYARINGATVGPFSTASAATFAAGAGLGVTFPASVVTYAINYASAGTWTVAQAISLNAAALPAGLTGSVLRLGQVDGTIARLEVDSFGTSAPGVLSIVYGRGTAAAPTAVQSGDELGSFNSWGYIGAGTLSSTAVAAFRTYAAETFSSGHQGSQACISTTAIAAATLTNGLCQNNDFGVTIASPTGGSKGAGTLNATGLYVSNVSVLTANQTITLTGVVTGSGTTSITTAFASNPALGAATATSVAIGGCTIGSNVLCATGTTNLAGATTVTGASFGLSGNISAAAWTTSGVRYKNVAATLTDTSSSGTVATAYTDIWGGNTIAASSAATFTNYYGSYFKVPAAGTNVVITNPYAIGADSANFATLAVGGVGVTLPISVANSASGVANLATMAAYTIKGNATSSTAAPTDILLSGLTNKASPTSSDILLISDEAASHALKYSTIAQLVGAVTSGVSSVGNASSDTSLTITGTGSGPWTGAVTVKLNLAVAQTWTALQTHNNSMIAMLGSSTGKTTLTSANAGASNYTATLQAASGTLAYLDLAGQLMAGGANVTPFSIGSVSSGTTTIDCSKNPQQWMVNTGASTIAAPTSDSSCTITVIDGASAGLITPSGFVKVGGATFAQAATASASCTATSASPAVFTYTSNGLINNQPVYLSGTTAPTGFALGTVYYVNAVATNTFQLAATPGGASINSSSTGTSITCNVPSVYALVIVRTNGLSTASWVQQQ